MIGTSARVLAVACLFVAGAGCNGAAPKPLPGGPPPEYEPARSYDGGVGEPAPSGQPGPAPAPAAPPPE